MLREARKGTLILDFLGLVLTSENLHQLSLLGLPWPKMAADAPRFGDEGLVHNLHNFASTCPVALPDILRARLARLAVTSSTRRPTISSPQHVLHFALHSFDITML